MRISPNMALTRIENRDPLKEIVFAKNLDDDCIWDIVLSLNIVQDYLKSLSPGAIISLAIEINELRIWKLVLARLDIDLSKALRFSKILCNDEIFDVVTKRLDFNK